MHPDFKLTHCVIVTLLQLLVLTPDTYTKKEWPSAH